VIGCASFGDVLPRCSALVIVASRSSLLTRFDAATRDSD
jgi:hypothetical protein